MERSFPLKLIAPALFVLLLLSSMGEVLGSRTGILKEVTDEKYSMNQVAEVAAEVAIMAANNGNVNHKNAFFQAVARPCEGPNSYCNTGVGFMCCAGYKCETPWYMVHVENGRGLLCS